MSTPAVRPIPAFYAVYILRSTVRHASLYIGSTPNPPRRLKQHNGELKGGANRTSRKTLQPWEMIGIVSGFTSALAALRFDSSIRQSPGKRKKRQKHANLSKMLTGLYQLVESDSFRRWPLCLHVFHPDFLTTWESITADQKPRESFSVLIDIAPSLFPKKKSKKTAPQASTSNTTTATTTTTTTTDHGIHTLTLGYDELRDYVAKSQSMKEFERVTSCRFCQRSITPGKVLYAVCPNHECEVAGHLVCWSQHLLSHDSEAEEHDILPVRGHCPSCTGKVRWVDMMKEVSLRSRGEKDIERLLKPGRKKKAETHAVSDDDNDGDEEAEDEDLL